MYTSDWSKIEQIQKYKKISTLLILEFFYQLKNLYFGMVANRFILKKDELEFLHSIIGNFSFSKIEDDYWNKTWLEFRSEIKKRKDVQKQLV